MKKLLLVQLLVLFALVSVSAHEHLAQRENPWPMEELMKSPKFKMEPAVDGVRKVVYESIDYRGAKKKVFAYYSSPGTLKGNPALDKDLPAVVCVHGGGGRAFPDWVKLWAEKGYAAISMDTYGKAEEKNIQLEGGYEKKAGTFVATVEDQKEDWFFNAVADVVSAHSLMLNLKQVNPKKTAVVGVSWGGIITSLVSGLDPRYKVAVPIYGCGFLYETGSMAPQIKRDGARGVKRWETMYDPALYAVDAKIPVLYVNGTNDSHFFLDQWDETVKLSPKAERSMRIGMKHGHGVGWRSVESYSFINYHLGIGKAIPSAKFVDAKFEKGMLTCTIKGAPKGTKAYLNHTNVEAVNNKAVWSKSEVSLNGENFSTKIDDSMMQWFISVEFPTKDGYSSEIFFRNGHKLWD